jgi:Papain family cysteine protease
MATNDSISRRSLLALAASGALGLGLASCSTHHRSQEPPEDPSDDPAELTSYGYDPDLEEPGNPEPPERLDHLPPAATVPTEWLPPVGRQSMPNCFVWSTIYGLATFHAARTSQTRPLTPDLQAAPDYAYIRQETVGKNAGDSCQGGSIAKSLDWLKSNGGTPSLAAAPNHFKKGDQPSCRVNWSDYHSRTIEPDPRFLITDYKLTHITGKDGLNNLRTAIARGSPIAFGTSLYADFKHYRGGGAPYVGNGQLLHESNGKKAGHAMLVVAYDDNHHGRGGAVRIQNSWGTSWGERGFVWMAYETFEKLAQSKGIYLK